MVRIRTAEADDLAAVRNLVDGAALGLDHDRLESCLARGEVFLAESEPREVALGTLVLDGDRVVAVAVRRRRRGQGIGTDLVRTAMEDCERLVAEFDPRVRTFWESVGFDVTPVGEDEGEGEGSGGRLRGVRKGRERDATPVERERT